MSANSKEASAAHDPPNMVKKQISGDTTESFSIMPLNSDDENRPVHAPPDTSTSKTAVDVHELCATEAELDGEVFHFLDLPREIRDKIYGYLLIGELVEQRIPNPDYDPSPTGITLSDRRLIGGYANPKQRVIRTQNTFIHILAYSFSISRVSHQVYEEASLVFDLRNFWILVRVDIKDFGKGLKAHGFAVVPCEVPDSIHRNVVLHAVASFPPEDTPREVPSNDSDTFLMTIEGHDQLPRALGTIFWSSERVLYRSLRPQLASQPELEERLLRPFLKGHGRSVKGTFAQPKDLQGQRTVGSQQTIQILRVVEKERPQIKFDFQEHLLGGASIDATGSPLTDEALAAAKNADAVLLGAIGGPKYGTGPIRPEQGLLKLRKELNTFGNLRPCNFASDSLTAISPLKEHVCRGVDFTIIRELTGGIYFGERKEEKDDDGYAWDTEPYSRAEIERVTRLAAHLAMATEPPQKVWSLDKANVLATSRLWRKVVSEVMKNEFPQLQLGHHLIDSAAMLMVKDPRALNGVIVTSNLFGDIISDEASVIPGSLGLLPSASLNGVPDGKSVVSGIYEPIHGSAPDIAGQKKVNPVAMILSTAMMLQYSFNQPEEARAIEEAVRRTIDANVRTGDIGGKSTTEQVGDHVAQELSKILSG
ncbi:MAG: 3-isopropylmalate dehydrogenase [Alectoria sarmentosa]|nr:MAG: 3-isopropylmalate dehydrogenase [Alectoria sarmentosa]